MARHPPLALALALLTALATTPSSTQRLVVLVHPSIGQDNIQYLDQTIENPGPADPCVSLPQSSLGRAACDVTTPGGPWVVIQSRKFGNVPFNRKWYTYRVGFGQVGGDYWLGLEAMNYLCPPARPCQLRVDVSYHGACPYRACVPRQSDGRYHSLYGRFAVANHRNLYRLTVGLYNSTASTGGDGLYFADGSAFSTVDADHDTADWGSCSANNGDAGWWFHYCGYTLNGRWGAGGDQGSVWYPVTNFDSVASSRMMVRMAA